MRVGWIVVVLAACGRIGFDPADDRAVHGDGGAAAGDGSSTGDAPPGEPVAGDICATARTIAVGEMLASESLLGAVDDYPGLFCGDGPDIVYRFVQPASGMRQVEITPTFRGSFYASATCPPQTGTCNAFFADMVLTSTPNLAAGVHYFVIDWVSGNGTTFAIRVE